MDLDHALHVFKLYCYRLEREPSERESFERGSSLADAMLLTEEEKQAISDIKQVVLEYSPLFAGKTEPAGEAA